ncbi:MAG: SDR family oxidoreductase [Ignavibacteriales bacterium]|nr:MAG: SDR family oxidoreductase [Ignavibacteriales bacterium]
MRRSILITGGSGLLALNWALTFREKYNIILGIHKRKVELKDVTTMSLNLESLDALVATIRETNPYLIIHTASLTNVEECEDNLALAYHVHVNLTKNVAEAAAFHGTKFIHISTDHFFKGDIPYVNENENYAPLNVYAYTKAEAEKAVQGINFNSLIIRTNFFAWGPSYRRSFSDFVIYSLRANKKITLFSDVFFTPIISEKLIKIVHELSDLQAKGIFNVVGDERISKYEFGLRIAKYFNLDSSLISDGSMTSNTTLVKRPLDMSLSNKKTTDFIGKKIGNVDEFILRLLEQEEKGITKEINNIASN